MTWQWSKTLSSTWCWKSVCRRDRRTCNAACDTSFAVVNTFWFISTRLSVWNSHRPHKLRPGEYGGGCQSVSTCRFARNSFVVAALWGRALSNCRTSSLRRVGFLSNVRHLSPALRKKSVKYAALTVSSDLVAFTWMKTIVSSVFVLVICEFLTTIGRFSSLETHVLLSAFGFSVSKKIHVSSWTA